MKTTRLAAEVKRFFGPIIFVTFAWFFIRWTAAIITARRHSTTYSKAGCAKADLL